MNEAFADTSGWASLFVRSEPFHPLAKRVVRRWQARGTTVVTTNYILAELVALFTSPMRVPRPLLIAYIDTIRSAPWVDVVQLIQLTRTPGLC